MPLFNNGFVDLFSNQTVGGNKTLSGTTNLSALTASRPLKIDGSKNITATQIDLTAGADVTGTLPATSGGTGLATLGNRFTFLNVDTAGTALAYNSSLDGWSLAAASGTYVSSSSFTMSGDFTGIFEAGTKIKFTNSTLKYANVRTATYSAPNTTVTIYVNNDYTVANTTISNIYFSKGNPQGFPASFNWTPSLSASGLMTVSAVTNYYAKYWMAGGIGNFQIRQDFTLGGSAGILVFATLPSTSSQDDSAWNGICRLYENGGTATTNGGNWRVNTGNIEVYKIGAANFTLGAGAEFSIIGSYRL